MADIAEKLYPPTIGRTIPAFYNENGTAKITVPFSMNRAVGVAQISGFSLLIKTIQSNTVIATLTTEKIYEALDNNYVLFTWSNQTQLSKIKIGQYLKIQLAYIGIDKEVGYYSTIGIIKYTSKPTIYIDGMSNVQNNLIFKRSYVGVYEVSSDKTERPFYYNFCLYNSLKELVETSGWRLHNTETYDLVNAYTIDQTTDEYTFESALNQNERYYITYSVRTINNLEITTQYYPCMDIYGGESSFYVDFQVENNFDEGYIDLGFKLKDNINPDDANLKSPVSISICRADNKDNFKSWRVIKRAYFTSYYAALHWSFKDFTVEQGVYYQYSFQQYNSNGFYSERVVSNPIMADFEDMFLWDGEKQLKIKFNPKVSSFKTTLLQQKVDTIGNKYPFIFKNGYVEYKEFPIAGLISYYMDRNENFIDYNNELGIQNYDYYERDYSGLKSSREIEKMPTTNLLNYNIFAERTFKLKVLDWLNNGKIKLFRSPAEGNYFVRLLNVSMTPEDKLGRMIHNFTSTAYEMADFTYENLIKYNFVNTSEPEVSEENILSFYFEDRVKELFGRYEGIAQDLIDLDSWYNKNKTILTNQYERLIKEKKHSLVILFNEYLDSNAGYSSFLTNVFEIIQNGELEETTKQEKIQKLTEQYEERMEKVFKREEDLEEREEPSSSEEIYLAQKEQLLKELQQLEEDFENELTLLEEKYNEDYALISQNGKLIKEPLKLNKYPIVNYLKIDIPVAISNISTPLIFCFKDEDTGNFNRFKVQPGSNLILNGEGSYQDLYFCFADNFTTQELINFTDVMNKLKKVLITHKYNNKVILSGNFNNIESMSVDTIAETLIGPRSIENSSFNSLSSDNLQEIKPIKFFKLTFYRKEILEIYKGNNEEYFYDKNLTQPVQFFSPIYIYQVNNKYYSYSDEAGLLECSEIDTTIRINTGVDQQNGSWFDLKEMPVLDLSEDMVYENIILGNGVYADCAFLAKIVKYSKIEEEE